MKWVMALCVAMVGCIEVEAPEPIELPEHAGAVTEAAPERIDCPTAVRTGAHSFDDLIVEESAQWALLLSCVNEHADECRWYRCVESTTDFGSPPITGGCLQCVAQHCFIELAFCLQP